MYKRKGERQSGDKVGGTDLEFVTVALSTVYSYNDEETLRAVQPQILLHGFDEPSPALNEQGLTS
jgi:hypothetical protein